MCWTQGLVLCVAFASTSSVSLKLLVWRWNYFDNTWADERKTASKPVCRSQDCSQDQFLFPCCEHLPALARTPENISNSTWISRDEISHCKFQLLDLSRKHHSAVPSVLSREGWRVTLLTPPRINWINPALGVPGFERTDLLAKLDTFKHANKIASMSLPHHSRI